MRSTFLAAALVVSAPLAAADGPRPFQGASALEWSLRIGASEMERHPPGQATKWDYSQAVLDLALVDLGAAAKDTRLVDYGTRAVTGLVGADGSIRGYSAKDHTLDAVLPGRVVLAAWERGERSAPLRQALGTLRAQMASQPRNAEGGFWHKDRYPDQMWLDGLYMAGPFLAHYGRDMQEPALFDEVARQLILADQYTFVAASGLHRHAWDAAHRQAWADPASGLSPNFWTRSIGWYAMALVDTLDCFPASHPDRPRLLGILGRSAEGWVRWQDPGTGVWWQVTDAGNRAGNYLEASGSSMLVYALAKAVNRGWLPAAPYAQAARRGYAGLVGEFTRDDGDGMWSVTHVCQVAGLGYTNAAGRPRDGSFGYYVSEPVVDNDPKGTGPFIEAGIEVQAMLAP